MFVNTLPEFWRVPFFLWRASVRRAVVSSFSLSQMRPQELLLNEFSNQAVMILLRIIENRIQVKFDEFFCIILFFLWFSIELCDVAAEIIQLLSVSNEMVFVIEISLFLEGCGGYISFRKWVLAFSFQAVFSLFFYLFIEEFYHFWYILVYLIFFTYFAQKLLPYRFAFFNGKFPPVFGVIVTECAFTRWVFFFNI